MGTEGNEARDCKTQDLLLILHHSLLVISNISLRSTLVLGICCWAGLGFLRIIVEFYIISIITQQYNSPERAEYHLPRLHRKKYNIMGALLHKSNF